MAASPEALLISAVLRTKDYALLTQQGITQEMFGAFPDEFKWIDTYYTRYQKTPSKGAFQAKFPDFTVYAVDEVEHYCEATKESFSHRAIADLLDRSVDLMMAGDVEKAMTSLGTDLLRIQAAVQNAADDYDIASDWEATYQKILDRVARVEAGKSAGIPTGFGTLDLNTGGLQPGWTTIVGGRLSAGKTWTMVRMAHAAVMEGYTAMYYSLEQPRDQIAIRSHVLMSREWGTEVFRQMDLQRGHGFNLLAYKKFLEELEENIPGRFVVNDTSRGRVGPMTVAAGIEREDPDIVFIDYLTLMKQSGDGGWLSVADLSASMQQLAQRYNKPLVIGSQLNRTAMGDDEPDAGKIGRSDAVGQDADLVVMVTKKTESVRKMSLAKNRHGPDGMSWYAKWLPNTGEIEEISGDDASNLMEHDKMED